MTFDARLIGTLLVLGLTGGFFSGLLGIGGAIIMIPLLRFIPPLLGLGSLDMKVIAGITMVQVFFASASGILAHGRARKVSRELVLFMGGASFLGALAGSVGSKYLNGDVITVIFVVLALVAAGLMFIPRKEWGEDIPADKVRFKRPLASSIALGVGGLAGILGAGGAFILIPLQLHVLKIPTRVAVGSTLGIVLLAASAGLLGKLGTGQVPIPLAAALVAGALPGAWLGTAASLKLKVESLRRILTIVIAATALRMLYDVLVR